jgi:hypothetical protein
MGLPEFYSTSLPACHGLITLADLHILAKSDASVMLARTVPRCKTTFCIICRLRA